MSASHHAHALDGVTTGILMSLMIAGERGRMRAQDRREQADAIVAHNQGVARARAARRRRDAAIAAQVAVGQSRMARWIDRAGR